MPQVPAESFSSVQSFKICDMAVVGFVCGQVFAAGDASLAEHATCRSFQRMCNASSQSALPDSLFALQAVGFTAFVTSRDGEVFMFFINHMRSSFGGKKAILQPFHAIRGASFVTSCSLAYATIGSAAIRSSGKSKDDTIKLLRTECEQLNAKVAPALVSDAAAVELKVALHEANTQRASLMKYLSYSQKKLSELTGNKG